MKNYFDNEIKKESNGMKLESKKTDLRKAAFIEEIKNGLGEEIKLNPNRVEVVIPKKENFFKRFLSRIKKML